MNKPFRDAMARLTVLALFCVFAVTVPVHGQTNQPEPRSKAASDSSKHDPACGPLRNYLRKAADTDTITSRDVGTVNGFAVYEVTHIFDSAPEEFDGLKEIVVERTPGEFCETLSEEAEAEALSGFEPSYFVKVDSQTVLVSRDPLGGNGGAFEENYWTFDSDGPVFLDVNDVINDALKKYVPPGLSTLPYSTFDIRTLTLSYIFDIHSSNPSLRLKFALKDHKLVLISHTIQP